MKQYRLMKILLNYGSTATTMFYKNAMGTTSFIDKSYIIECHVS